MTPAFPTRPDFELSLYTIWACLVSLNRSLMSTPWLGLHPNDPHALFSFSYPFSPLRLLFCGGFGTLTVHYLLSHLTTPVSSMHPPPGFYQPSTQPLSQNPPVVHLPQTNSRARYFCFHPPPPPHILSAHGWFFCFPCQVLCP